MKILLKLIWNAVYEGMDLIEVGKCRELKEEALDRTLGRTRFGKDYGPVVRQTTE
jgi:hypothetical protein